MSLFFGVIYKHGDGAKFLGCMWQILQS